MSNNVKHLWAYVSRSSTVFPNPTKLFVTKFYKGILKSVENLTFYKLFQTFHNKLSYVHYHINSMHPSF